MTRMSRMGLARRFESPGVRREKKIELGQVREITIECGREKKRFTIVQSPNQFLNVRKMCKKLLAIDNNIKHGKQNKKFVSKGYNPKA